MKIKSIVGLFFLMASITGFTACGNDDEPAKGSDVTLKGVNDIETKGLQVDANSTSATFSVYAPVTPTVSADQSWVKGTATEPSKLNSVSQITLSIEPNTATTERGANITVGASGSTITIRLNQGAAEPEPEPEPEPEETQPLLGINASDIADDYIAGWNIGNTLEVPGGETGWGNPRVNEAYVKGIKAAGFNMVRIPCAWNSHLSDKNTNTIDPAWLDRVNEVVNWVIENDMYAVLNIHWDEGWLENNIGEASKPVLIEKQKTLWTQIANRLGHYNEKLMFAGLNEPNVENAAGMSSLLDYEQAFIDAVRATGGNNAKRTLIVQGPSTDINKTNELMEELPVDPAGEGYMMAEIHYYDPYQYTIMEKDESWGKVSWFWGTEFHKEGSDRNATWGEEDWMLSQFEKMKKQFVDKGIPVIIGEYGAYPESHYANLQTAEDKELIKASRVHFYECVSQYAAETGLMPFVWDTGELIDRNNGSVKNQSIIDAITK